MLILEPSVKAAILDDVRQTYPDECCGFLFGTETGENRIVETIQVVNNAKEGDKRRRFEIAPRDYLRAEQYALDNDLQLLGVYHSHPDSPAIPSEHDRVAAQPWFSYIIVSYYGRGRSEILSWRLNDDSRFEPEPLLEAVEV